jgi:uncharacterized protein
MISRKAPLFSVFFIALFSLLAPFQSALAVNPGISDRMRERLPVIDSLKTEGRIGENNLGFLAVRGVLNDKENGVVAAENDDRAEVYKMIGERTGNDPVSVGRARADQIAQRSAPGVWLQDQTGRWYRKQ